MPGRLLATEVAPHGWFDTDLRGRYQDSGRGGDGVFQRVAREDHSEARSPRVRFLLGLAWWLQASAWARLFAPWPCFAAGIPVAADMWANQLRAFSLHLQR
jgi:hypothetical protein